MAQSSMFRINQLAKDLGHKVYADWGMNIYNSVTAVRVKDFAESLTLSPEISLQGAKIRGKALCVFLGRINVRILWNFPIDSLGEKVV